MGSVNRIVMQRTSRRWLEELPLSELAAAEISGKHGKRYDFKSYERFRFPKYDICEGPFVDADGRARKFDMILANQVWEHLDRPYAATKNVRKMLRKGAYFWVAVPFFIPYHGAPVDCSRWSARGLKNLLVEAGFDITVAPPHVDETAMPGEPPADTVLRLARSKAAQITPQFPRDLVLAADTVIVYNHELMGKPAGLADARRMLETLSGKTHEVLTGVCLLRETPRVQDAWVCATKVMFHRLTPAVIDEYMRHVHVLDKAGAYAIQEYGEMLIARIDGLQSNVVGLPVEEVRDRLRKAIDPN